MTTLRRAAAAAAAVTQTLKEYPEYIDTSELKSNTCGGETQQAVPELPHAFENLTDKNDAKCAGSKRSGDAAVPNPEPKKRRVDPNPPDNTTLAILQSLEQYEKKQTLREAKLSFAERYFRAEAREKAQLDAYRCSKCPPKDSSHFDEARAMPAFAQYFKIYQEAFQVQRQKIDAAMQAKIQRNSKDPTYQHYHEKFENFPAGAIILDHPDYKRDLKELLGIEYMEDDCKKYPYQDRRKKLAIVPDVEGTGQWKVIALEDIEFKKGPESTRILCRYIGENCLAEGYRRNALSLSYTVKTKDAAAAIDDSVKGDVAGRINHFKKPTFEYWADAKNRIYVVARAGVTLVKAGEQIGCSYLKILNKKNLVNIGPSHGLKLRKSFVAASSQKVSAAAAAAPQDTKRKHKRRR